MKNIIMFLLMFGLLGSAYSQTLTIKDQETNEPVELVTLSVGSKIFTTTNSKGPAYISKFKDANSI